MPDDVETVAEAVARGLAAHRADRLDEAEHCYRSALRAAPDHLDAAQYLGALLIQRGLHGEAEGVLALTIALHPDRAVLHFLHGLALSEQGRFEAAIASFDRAIAFDPGYCDAIAARGDAQARRGRFAEAIANFERAIALRPRDAELFYKRGEAEKHIQRIGPALASFERALALKPDYFEAWVHRGNIHLLRKRMAEAVADYGRALALKPDSAGVLYNRGTALKELKRLPEALADYEKALALEPGLPHLEGARLHARMLMCDWRDFEATQRVLLSHVAAGIRAAMPFVILPMASTPGDQRISATLYAQAKFPAAAPLWRGERYAHDRIRIAYLSGAFIEHPAGLAMADVFAAHDKSRFETIAISFSPDDGGATRRRVEPLFDKFIDASDRDDHYAAEVVRSLEADIAIDLDGFTDVSRTGVAALRPAPVQVNYLGFPCTMGASYIDYLIADRTAISDPAPYAEKIVWMPDTFFPAGGRPAPPPPPSRKDYGLPETGLVFCAFNNNYKITPDIFDVWMRLLGRIAGSVLWLRQLNPAVEANLVREAGARDIAPERLVFAPTLLTREEHFARQQLADIFLDTLYYNAHSTAADALWCGVPLVTCKGPAFAGRVAASLLGAAGLGELVAHSLQDYEALAFKLACDPALLAAVKAKLAARTHPLFDTARFTRHLQRAYEGMWERHQRGAPPESFAVEPI